MLELNLKPEISRKNNSSRFAESLVRYSLFTSNGFRKRRRARFGNPKMGEAEAEGGYTERICLTKQKKRWSRSSVVEPLLSKALSVTPAPRQA